MSQTPARLTVRLSVEQIETLDALVEADRFEHRSAALRAALGLLLEQEARLITETARGGRTTKHLPDGEGGSLCTCVDDACLTRIPSDRVVHLELCRGCDPAVEIDRSVGSASTLARELREVSTHGHE